MLRLVCSLLLGALLLTACQTTTPEPPPDPLALVTEASTNIRTMKTFRMLVEQSGAPFYVLTDLGNVQFRRAEAQYVAPRDMQAHVRLLAMGLPADVDVFSRGDNQWYRNSILTANRWFNAPFSPGFNPENLIASETGFQSALQAMENLQYIGVETLEDGSSVYHLKAKANGPDVSALMAGLVEMTGNVDVDVYISRDKKLPTRFVIVDPATVTKEQPKPTTWTMDIYDFNAPAQIEDPETTTSAPIAEVTEAAQHVAATRGASQQATTPEATP